MFKSLVVSALYLKCKELNSWRLEFMHQLALIFLVFILRDLKESFVPVLLAPRRASRTHWLISICLVMYTVTFAWNILPYLFKLSTSTTLQGQVNLTYFYTPFQSRLSHDNLFFLKISIIFIVCFIHMPWIFMWKNM